VHEIHLIIFIQKSNFIYIEIKFCQIVNLTSVFLVLLRCTMTLCLIKNTTKMQHLDSNKLAARTLSRVFIAHYDLHDAHSSDSKAIEQLVIFPRKTIFIAQKLLFSPYKHQLKFIYFHTVSQLRHFVVDTRVP